MLKNWSDAKMPKWPLAITLLVNFLTLPEVISKVTFSSTPSYPKHTSETTCFIGLFRRFLANLKELKSKKSP
jgi:hypothetical protein